MNSNVFRNASFIATVVVAGTTLNKIHTHRVEKKRNKTEKELLSNFYSAEFLAFRAAQRDIEMRAMHGYYDNISDDDVQQDYNQLYVRYLTGEKKI